MKIRNPPPPEPKPGITPHQADVLRFIETFIAKNGYSPNMREMADGTGRSYRSIVKSVEGLERRRRIVRVKRTPRSIAVIR